MSPRTCKNPQKALNALAAGIKKLGKSCLETLNRVAFLKIPGCHSLAAMRRQKQLHADLKGGLMPS